jgi:hypothetical protein
MSQGIKTEEVKNRDESDNGKQKDIMNSRHHHVQNGSGAHPPSYPVGNRCLSL